MDQARRGIFTDIFMPSQAWGYMLWIFNNTTALVSSSSMRLARGCSACFATRVSLQPKIRFFWIGSVRPGN